MSTIEPGTPVIVTIKGSVHEHPEGGYLIQTPSGRVWAVDEHYDSVLVVPVVPERPTLEQVLAQHAQTTDGRYGEAPNCACGWRSTFEDGWPEFEPHLADELRAAGVAS